MEEKNLREREEGGGVRWDEKQLSQTEVTRVVHFLVNYYGVHVVSYTYNCLCEFFRALGQAKVLHPKLVREKLMLFAGGDDVKGIALYHKNPLIRMTIIGLHKGAGMNVETICHEYTHALMQTGVHSKKFRQVKNSLVELVKNKLGKNLKTEYTIRKEIGNGNNNTKNWSFY